MILKYVLFLSYAILVSSNSGFPVIPTQTCPIYQQNMYTNPSANQPSDIASYLQSMMVQNQSPPINLSPSSITQILLNRILSGQSTQAVLDQNVRGYGSNLVEYPNKLIASNLVGNYYNAPTVFDYLNDRTTDVNKETHVSDDKMKEKRTKKRKSSKSRRKHEESEKSHKNKKDRVNNSEDNNREVNKKSRKRFRNRKTDASSHDHSAKNNNNEGHKTKSKKRKNKEAKHMIDPIDEVTKVEEPKPRRRHKKKRKLDKDDTEKAILEQTTTLKPTEIQDIFNLAFFNEGMTEENRIPRNPIHEGNDLLKSIPNLPENIANSFNFKELQQFNNHPSMNNFMANFENIYQSMLSNNKETNKPLIIRRKPKRSRKQHRSKIVVKNINSTSTATEASVSTNSKPLHPKLNVVTTEKTIYINEKTHTNIDPIPKDEGLKSVDKPPEVEEATVKVFDKNEEVEDEYEPKDIDSNVNSPDPNYNNGYIEDYYPLFMDNAAYNANNREVYIKNLGDSKYFYAVDKGNPDLINRMRFESYGLPERIKKDYEVNKEYDDIEIESVRNGLNTDFQDMREELIQFRTPPHLESPDFQTRPIERSEINPELYYHFDENDNLYHRFVGDKSCSYSGDKTPYYTETKQNGINTPKNKDIETVFARSKVVKYGPIYSPQEDFTTEPSSYDLTDNRHFKNGGTTYVLATSLDHPESFW